MNRPTSACNGGGRAILNPPRFLPSLTVGSSQIESARHGRVLTVMGGVLGLLLGWSISRAAGLIFPNLPTAVPLWAAASGVAVSVGVGLFFGIWPASRAARLDPVEALRHE